MAVKNLPPPRYSFQFVILFQAVDPHLSKHSCFSPPLKVPVSSAPCVILAWKHFPLTACTQNIQHPIQQLAWFGRRSSLFVFLLLRLRNVALDHFPELITDIPPSCPSRQGAPILLSSQYSSPLPGGRYLLQTKKSSF